MVKRLGKPGDVISVSKRVIVVDEVDTHFRTISEVRDVETFAFSSPSLAIGAGRVLEPDLFVVGDPEHALDAARFSAEIRAHAELRSVPILILTHGAGGAKDGVAGDPACTRIDPDDLRAHLHRALALPDARAATDLLAEHARRSERYARHCDSLSRIALMERVDDRRFIEEVVREGAESLRDDVPFSATLLRLEGRHWVVETSYEPDAASVALPLPGSRMPLSETTIADVLAAGMTLLVRDDASELARTPGAGPPWRSVAAAPLLCGSTVYLMLLVSAEVPREAFDVHDRAYVDTLVSLCGARLRQRDHLAALRFYAEHDALTGVLNRAAFRARGIAAMRDAEGDGSSIAIAVLDLDRFHEMNDTIGHQKGDALLVEVAAALAERADADVVARLGGDAFGILLHGVRDRDELERRVARYSERFEQPFGTGDRDGIERLHLSASIGIACAPDDAQSFEELLARADAAMCAAKESARGRWWFFQPEVEASFAYARTLHEELASAVLDQDFVLHFQPEIDLATGAVVGAEALVRWNHPERGLLLPADFVPFAEEHGLLRSIGAWVMRGAATAAVRLRALDPSFRVWINLSPTELTNPTLVHRFSELGSVQRSLGVEIRQSSAMRSLTGTMVALAALKQAGVAIAIDDFGTGHWPLSELKHLPVDMVKLDRSFTAGLSNDPRDREILQAVLNLGTRFGFTTLAKGIETPEQARCLRWAGCARGQGYLLGRPMPLDDLSALIRSPKEQLR